MEYRILGYTEEHSTNWEKQCTEKESGKSGLLYAGVELETEGRNGEYMSDDTIHLIKDTFPCVLAEDGSLSGSGVEIISQPFTKAYWRELEPKLTDLFKTLSETRISHDSGSCGLHIHVTKPSDEVTDRIWFVMETYKDELIKFSRRTLSQLSDWARFLSDDNRYKEKVKCLSEIKKLKDSTSKYWALNSSHSNTIEFRLFRGTLNINTFYACLELTFNLVELCSDLSQPLSEITWEKLTTGTHVSKYVEAKNIYTNKVPRDMTKEYLRQKRKISIACGHISKILLADLNTRKKEVKTKINTSHASVYDEELLESVILDTSEFANKLRGLYNTASQYNDILGHIRNVETMEEFIEYIKRCMGNFSDTAKDKIEALDIFKGVEI